MAHNRHTRKLIAMTALVWGVASASGSGSGPGYTYRPVDRPSSVRFAEARDTLRAGGEEERSDSD